LLFRCALPSALWERREIFSGTPAGGLHTLFFSCLHFVVRRDLKILMPRGAIFFEMDGLEMVFALKYFEKPK
jgi:hypothetical protein